MPNHARLPAVRVPVVLLTLALPTLPLRAEPPASEAAPAAAPTVLAWTKLPTEPGKGKQDDISFISPEVGWYVSGALGRIFYTADGGATWTKQIDKPGTFFRCIAFLDTRRGFAGNIGPGYFPGVTDDVPLYRTTDGGETWTPVTTITGPAVTGLCALEVVRKPFINAGHLDHKVRIVGGGRVGGPPVFVSSDDLGETWTSTDLSDVCGMVLDVHFHDFEHGLIAAATSADVQQSRALILTTDDAGKTWTKRYESSRPFELTWKISFPVREVGYVTIQSYDPDTAASQRFIAKTTDGGMTWTELPLVNEHKVRQFGVCFTDANTGWVGAMPHGFHTADGGTTWAPVKFGNAVNKIRAVRSESGGPITLYAVGAEVHKLCLP